MAWRFVRIMYICTKYIFRFDSCLAVLCNYCSVSFLAVPSCPHWPLIFIFFCASFSFASSFATCRQACGRTHEY